METHPVLRTVRCTPLLMLALLLCAGPAFAAEMSIDQAKWSEKKGRLTVKGKGPTGTLITVSRVSDDSVIGTPKSKSRGSGKWKLKEKLAVAPCRIRAEANGVSVEADVEDAGSNCDESGPASTASGAPLTVKQAKWEARNSRITVKGEGPRDTVISVANAGDNSLIGTNRSRDKRDGDWRVRAVLPAPPCRVRVTVGDQAIEQDVQFAGDNCVNTASTTDLSTDTMPVISLASDSGEPLRIKEAKWERSDRRLVVKGEGPSSTEVKVSNAGDDSFIASNVSEDNDDGEWRIKVSLQVPPCRVRASAEEQTAEQHVKYAGDDCDAGDPPTPEPPPIIAGDSINSTSASTAFALDKVDEQPLINPGSHALLAANDLGMHCADLDYQVFSILPPFNVVHAQVIERNPDGKPRLLDDTDIEVVYSAASSANDPAQANTTAAERGEAVFKGNFWKTLAGDDHPLWYKVYAPLYFGLLEPTDLEQDRGLPVPDSMKLPGGDQNCLATYDGENPEVPRADCDLAQALMPGFSAPHVVNDTQHFDRFDRDFNFFSNLLGGLGLGAVVEDTNWFSLEGLAIMPVDDQGRNNAYPLMRVQAKDKATGEVLASTDVVLPVASEADCQQCHAETLDCETVNQAYDYGMQCSEEALGRAHPEIAGYVTPAVATISDSPGDTLEQRLLNAAKINILRLHDAKWGTMLDMERRVVCASCHYSPALDLAQLGPKDFVDPENPAVTTEQRQHISMSRAMHGHHGGLVGKDGTTPLFPAMPAPDDPIRDEPVSEHLDDYPLASADSEETVEQYVLQNACYSCHPGKRTDCLRGAMAGGGVVCQDCHGDMLAVGNDFSHDFPNNAGNIDPTRRVPWAVEPGCQSCHVGDATHQPADKSGFIYDDDGIRLLRAFRTGDEDATPIRAADSRFAENRVVNDQGQSVDLLYRLSKGHGGVMCEGCHGSTHAIWPNANPWANDNITATQIQGHSGTITECSACHEKELGLTLNGPHGMHPVASPYWNKEHEQLAERNSTSCKSCHGADGEGTVLSRTAAERTWECKDEKGTLCSDEDQIITVAKGTRVTCTQCHENEINHD